MKSRVYDKYAVSPQSCAEQGFNVSRLDLRTLGVLLVAAVFSLASTGCHSKPDMTSRHVIVANQFAEALAKGDFDGAHALLSAGAQQMFPSWELQKQYREMTGDGGGPATHVQVMQDLASWPGKQKDDVGWVYVAISGDTFSEAVTLVVSRENGQEVIRSIEWGRP